MQRQDGAILVESTEGLVILSTEGADSRAQEAAVTTAVNRTFDCLFQSEEVKRAKQRRADFRLYAWLGICLAIVATFLGNLLPGLSEPSSVSGLDWRRLLIYLGATIAIIAIALRFVCLDYVPSNIVEALARFWTKAV